MIFIDFHKNTLKSSLYSLFLSRFFQARESGIIPRIENTYTEFWSERYNSYEKPSLQTVGINQLVSVFSCYALACCAGLAIFFCELTITQKTGKSIAKRGINVFNYIMQQFSSLKQLLLSKFHKIIKYFQKKQFLRDEKK